MTFVFRFLCLDTHGPWANTTNVCRKSIDCKQFFYQQTCNADKNSHYSFIRHTRGGPNDCKFQWNKKTKKTISKLLLEKFDFGHTHNKSHNQLKYNLFSLSFFTTSIFIYIFLLLLIDAVKWTKNIKQNWK